MFTLLYLWCSYSTYTVCAAWLSCMHMLIDNASLTTSLSAVIVEKHQILVHLDEI